MFGTMFESHWPLNIYRLWEEGKDASIKNTLIIRLKKIMIHPEAWRCGIGRQGIIKLQCSQMPWADWPLLVLKCVYKMGDLDHMSSPVLEITWIKYYSVCDSNLVIWTCRDGSIVQSTCCSSEILGSLPSTHMAGHRSLKLHFQRVLHWYQACTWCTCKQTLIYLK